MADAHWRLAVVRKLTAVGGRGRDGAAGGLYFSDVTRVSWFRDGVQGEAVGT
jgi:hypothetical protein